MASRWRSISPHSATSSAFSLKRTGWEIRSGRSPPDESVERIYLPGERGDSILETRTRDGIPLPQGTWSAASPCRRARRSRPPKPDLSDAAQGSRAAGGSVLVEHLLDLVGLSNT